MALLWAAAAGPLVALLLHAPHAAWCAVFGYHLGCWIFSSLVPAPWGPRPRIARLGLVALGSGLLVAGSGAAGLHVWPALAQCREVWGRWTGRPPADLLFLAYYAAVNPWLEEHYWRAALFGPGVRRLVGLRAARGVCAGAFVLHHAAVLIPAFGLRLGLLLCASVLVAGVIWIAWRERAQNVWWSAASHAGADLGLVIAWSILLRSGA
jgi:hypothetical protein